jgi:peptide methionine sulfoxide reductase MsrB
MPRADQVTDEAIIKVFAVEVDTKEACAKVYVDAVTTERLFDGEEITSTHRGWRKVANHTSSYKVNYRIAKDTTLVDAKFKVARCVVCGTE